jgi:DNA-binding PadR family transcriptional regulator
MMDNLTKVEELALLAIWHLGDRAYGYLIRKHISREFEKEFSIGHLYSILNQLDRKGYVSKSEGEASESRRGKPKIYYSPTKEGLAALRAARKAYNLVWKGISLRAFENIEK